MDPRIVRLDDGDFDLRSDSAGLDRPAARLPGQLRRASCAATPTSARSAPRGCATRARPRCSTRTTCSPASATRADLLPLAFGERCMHEFVLSGAPMKRELGIRTLDLAKRLIDHGFHPPTVYFPLLVDEALLIEPTETETRETLDAFAEAHRGDPGRGGRGPGDREDGAAHDAGAAPGRGRLPRSGLSSGRRCSFPPHVAARVRRPRDPNDGVLEAVRAGGAEAVSDASQAEAIVWLDHDPSALKPLLSDSVRWVQLPWAGVEQWMSAGVIDDGRVWTCASEAYGDSVAEHVVALMLAGRRRIPRRGAGHVLGRRQRRPAAVRRDDGGGRHGVDRQGSRPAAGAVGDDVHRRQPVRPAGGRLRARRARRRAALGAAGGRRRRPRRAVDAGHRGPRRRRGARRDVRGCLARERRARRARRHGGARRGAGCGVDRGRGPRRDRPGAAAGRPSARGPSPAR